MELKVGDRVRYVVQRAIDNVKVGEVGIIRGISPSGSYAVDFEESGYRHNCDGLCQSNHGWWCSGDTLEPVDSKTLRIPTPIIKEDKKLKFTFYVKEGTRVDKTCNKLIPTMTTFITAESYGDSTYHGAATCDKADYNERQGCLEALANAMLGGNFDRDFNRAVKANEFADKKKRTCTYCGKVFDTVEEKQAEEAWHVERKKARRERYLLRKRAKEIAFEEQAQKMAKEMMGEQK